MVYCNVLKFVKLFYLSLSTFHSSSILVRGPDNKPVAIQNTLRSVENGLNHRYTFLANTSYSHCFKAPHEITWLYKDGKQGFKVMAFGTNDIRYPPTIQPMKAVQRSSRRLPSTSPHSSDSESSDDE